MKAKFIVFYLKVFLFQNIDFKEAIEGRLYIYPTILYLHFLKNAVKFHCCEDIDLVSKASIVLIPKLIKNMTYRNIYPIFTIKGKYSLAASGKIVPDKYSR